MTVIKTICLNRFKKIIFFLIIIFCTCAQAQLFDQQAFKKGDVLATIGGSFNIPGGDWSDFTDNGVSANLEFNYFLNSTIPVYISSGYMLFTGKTIADFGVYARYEREYRIIPLNIGGRFFLNSSSQIRPFISGGVGGLYITSRIKATSFFSSETSEGSSDIEFSYHGSAGVAIGKFVLAGKYTGFNGGNFIGIGLSYGTVTDAITRSKE